MKCPECNREIRIKKNQVIDCQCGARLMAVEINKKLLIENLKEEK
ncbi:hypothetical protein [Sporanaerobacter acetigenes]|nr:hypothetical protein [Sporanaerobacter acetigenes]